MTISTAILEPVVALLLLTCIMLIWLYATRIPAMLRANMEPDPELPNGVQMAQLPARVRWKADNYNHLLEQPTMFYAIAITIALLGLGDDINVALAWAYVAVRAVHSIVQAVWNKIMLRFLIFIGGSLILIAMIVRVAAALWL